MNNTRSTTKAKSSANGRADLELIRQNNLLQERIALLTRNIRTMEDFIDEKGLFFDRDAAQLADTLNGGGI